MGLLKQTEQDGAALLTFLKKEKIWAFRLGLDPSNFI